MALFAHSLLQSESYLLLLQLDMINTKNSSWVRNGCTNASPWLTAASLMFHSLGHHFFRHDEACFSFTIPGEDDWRRMCDSTWNLILWTLLWRQTTFPLDGEFLIHCLSLKNSAFLYWFSTSHTYVQQIATTSNFLLQLELGYTLWKADAKMQESFHHFWKCWMSAASNQILFLDVSFSLQRRQVVTSDAETSHVDSVSLFIETP